MISNNLAKIIQLMNFAEGLKIELRHGWLSNGRQESVADHSWRMALLLISIEPYLDFKIDLLKALKMVIVHDLAEAEVGDVFIFESVECDGKKMKKEKEDKVMQKLRTTLPDPLGEEFYQLWKEYDNKDSKEAKLLGALDKIEAQIQHNESPLDTWLPIEIQKVKEEKYLRAFCEWNPLLMELQELVTEEACKKISQQVLFTPSELI